MEHDIGILNNASAGCITGDWVAVPDTNFNSCSITTIVQPCASIAGTDEGLSLAELKENPEQIGLAATPRVSKEVVRMRVG